MPLASKVDKHLALDIELFSRGGLEILNAIERQGYDVSEAASGHLQAAQIVAAGACRRGKAVVSEHPLQLRAAYSVCRHIARSAAKNFYYGFLVLPATQAQRAVGGVCLHASRRRHLRRSVDSRPQQRREKLDEWMNALRRVVDGERTDDPVLYALADSQKRFNIPLELLEKLVHGTEMDVPEPAAAEAQIEGQLPQLQYETFDQLYDYCYHVASVVGLICIRIFGYRDPRAEKLAEETGVAFQLTNILRDVKEDAGTGASVFAARGFCALRNRRACADQRLGAGVAAAGAGVRGAARARLLPLGRRLAAADRRRQPACAVDPGGDLSSPCWSASSPAITTYSPSGYGSAPPKSCSVMARGFLRFT